MEKKQKKQLCLFLKEESYLALCLFCTDKTALVYLLHLAGTEKDGSLRLF